MLPNLASLSLATGRLQNARAWVAVRRFKKEEPNTDPITLNDWRAWKREEGDGPVPKYGWILEVDKGDGKRTPEPQYLYDVEELAKHLINGGVSPLSRLPAHKKDMEECIDKANELRANRDPPLPPLQSRMAEKDAQQEYLDVERAAWEMIWERRLAGERSQVLQNGSLIDDATVEMLEGWLGMFDHLDARLFVAEVQSIFDVARADRRLTDPRTIRALVESLEELTVSIIEPDEIMELATRPRSMPTTAWEFDMLQLINLRNGGLDLLEDDASREQTKMWFRHMRMLLVVWARYIREADELASQLYRDL